jgi:hypothetical protein
MNCSAIPAKRTTVSIAVPMTQAVSALPSSARVKTGRRTRRSPTSPTTNAMMPIPTRTGVPTTGVSACVNSAGVASVLIAGPALSVPRGNRSVIATAVTPIAAAIVTRIAPSARRSVIDRQGRRGQQHPRNTDIRRGDYTGAGPVARPQEVGRRIPQSRAARNPNPHRRDTRPKDAVVVLPDAWMNHLRGECRCQV